MRRIILAMLASMTIGGCGLAHNQILFATKANVGLDVDTRPPTVQLNLNRTEVSFAPTFDVGQTPPVAASFRSEFRGILGIFFNVASTFTGGDAAATMTGLFDAPGTGAPHDSTLCLNGAPSRWSKHIVLPDEKEIRPFLFGTDTSFGLKAAWSGMTAQFPDSVKIGYNRKELAWAPVFVREHPCTLGGPGLAPINGTHMVKVPSFLATIDIVSKVGRPDDTGTEHLQYFATGVAATNLARQYAVRKTMLRRLDPETKIAVATFGTDKQSGCISTWLDADPGNHKRLTDWMKGLEGTTTTLVFGKEYADARKRAVGDLGIPCP